MEKIPILAVVGPTASGKTRLAVWLAAQCEGEVVSADSMQIYRGMSIGTAKPTVQEMQGIPHHLLDCLDPQESFSVADYVELAAGAVEDIHNRGRFPILAGGTGLYLSSLLDGMPFDAPSPDAQLRESLQAYAREKGSQALFARLRECDPPLAQQLHPNNVGRVIRAIEVYEKTGVPMSRWQAMAKQKAQKESRYLPCVIGLDFKDRQKLYDRINERVDKMMEQGLLEEVRAFYEKGCTSTAAQAIGYKELYAYLKGEMELSQAVEHLKRQTRRYAKRQLTWFRRDERVHWIYLDECPSFEAAQITAAAIAGRVLGENCPHTLARIGQTMVEYNQ